MIVIEAVEWVVQALFWIIVAFQIGIIGAAAVSEAWRLFFGRKEEAGE